MYYGNLIVGTLLDVKHLGRGTLTDVGTICKLCQREALVELLPHLNPLVNLEFNAYFLDTALGRGFTVAACAITFHPRIGISIGISKGGNVDNLRVLGVGCRMVVGISFGWHRS
jgi:hypothetical protein